MVMKIRTKVLSLIPAVCLVASVAVDADKLVILHTNDTHSQIDSTDDGRGGILRRKVLIDSVRAAEPNVILIDAGDVVQGTLYFTLYAGEVERKMMNELGYDIQILGNHEFDNGVEALADMYSKMNASKLSTNYDFSGTALDGLFKPYEIREIGGKRIAFMGINIDPEGMIASKNCVGVKYLDGFKAANATAWHLKHNEKVDMVVAITHIGYEHDPGPGDVSLVRSSEDIDLVIGGHSHTLIDPTSDRSPECRVANADGDMVLIAQAGRKGQYVGEITIDLDDMSMNSRVIPVNGRFDGSIDGDAAGILEQYRRGVDSLQSIKVGHAKVDFTTSTPGLLNMMSDFVKDEGSRLLGEKVDMGIINKGGIRCGMPKGDISRGLIMQMLPFDNRLVVLEISGSDLLAALDVMASRGGDGVSDGVEALIDGQSHRCVSATIDGKAIDPDATYKVATIDYLANGGDYMKPLKNGTLLTKSNNVLYDDLIKYLSGKKKSLKPDNTQRMKLK